MYSAATIAAAYDKAVWLIVVITNEPPGWNIKFNSYKWCHNIINGDKMIFPCSKREITDKETGVKSNLFIISQHSISVSLCSISTQICAIWSANEWPKRHIHKQWWQRCQGWSPIKSLPTNLVTILTCSVHKSVQKPAQTITKYKMQAISSKTKCEKNCHHDLCSPKYTEIV